MRSKHVLLITLLGGVFSGSWYLHTAAQETDSEKGAPKEETVSLDAAEAPSASSAASLEPQRLGSLTAESQTKEIPEKYVAIGRTFEVKRASTRLAFEALKHYMPNLDRYLWYTEKTLKRDSDREAEREYLASEVLLHDFDQLFANYSEFTLSNVGEVGRFHMLEAVNQSLKLDNNAYKHQIIERLVDALQKFPEGATLTKEQKSSLAADKIQMALLISRHEPSAVEGLNANPQVHKIFKHIIDNKLAAKAQP